MSEKLLLTQQNLKKNTTLISLVVDISGSMARNSEKSLLAVETQIEKIKQNIDAQNDYYLSIIVFNAFTNTVLQPTLLTPSFTLTPFIKQQIKNCNGNTALNDATSAGIASLSNYNIPATAYLVVIFTDGEENCSSTPTRNFNTIKNHNNLPNWTFAYVGPKNSWPNEVGIPEGNWLFWENTFTSANVGMMGSTVSAYSNDVKKGVLKTSSYFKGETDATKIDLKQLDLVTSQYAPKKVDKEVDITTFYNYHRPKEVYDPKAGKVYYQLMKREIIQDSKAVLLRDKKTKAIYAGAKVKPMLGLDQVGDWKVTPGNHANFDIFVQSMSPNRKLVRGTEVLLKK